MYTYPNGRRRGLKAVTFPSRKVTDDAV